MINIEIKVGNRYTLNGEEIEVIQKINKPYSLCRVRYSDGTTKIIPTPRLLKELEED